MKTTQIGTTTATPSRLNEYPVGTTSPTTLRLQPKPSSRPMSCGRTLSDEDVPSTTYSSLRSARISLNSETPTNRVTPPSTTTMKTANASMDTPTSFISALSVSGPYFPT